MKLLILGVFLAQFVTSVSMAKPIIFEASLVQTLKVKSWIMLIEQSNIGRKYLNFITSGNKQLIIRHNTYARMSAGKTLVPMTTATEDGRGVDEIEIELDLNMTLAGTHLVVGDNAELIHFVAPVNLFHEMSHAYHAMKGDFKASEVQAIQDENIFRQEWGSVIKCGTAKRSILSHDSSKELTYTDMLRLISALAQCYAIR